MARMIFDYNKMLQYLSFMELNITDLNEITLKKNYHKLAKKYHPDLVTDYHEKQIKTKQFQELSDCYKYLLYCLEHKNLWKDKINNTPKKDYGKCDNDLSKYYQDIINRLDKLVRPLNLIYKSNYNKVIKYIITILLDDIEFLKSKCCNSDIILDYGTIANYCELIELFVNKVFKIDVSNNFQLNKNNYVSISNDKFFKEKGEICLIEKNTLYEVLVKIINFIDTEGKYMNVNQYKKSIKKYIDVVDDINNDISSFKWLLVLPNLDIKMVTDELNKIKKRKR